MRTVRRLRAAGAVTASRLWFLLLAGAAHGTRRFLTKERVWFDRVSGLVLLGFSGRLACEFVHVLL